MPVVRSVGVVLALAVTALMAVPVRGAAPSAPVGWRLDGTGRYPATDPPTTWSAGRNVVWRTPLPTWGNASPVVVGDRVFVAAEPSSLLCLRASDGKLLWSHDNRYLDTLSGGERDAMAVRLAQADEAKAELDATNKRISALKRALRKRKRDGEDPRAELERLTARASTLKKELDATSQFRTPPTHDIIGYASSTPVSDGETVYALFAHGVVAAYALDGTRRWIRWLGHTPHMNGNPDGHAASPLIAGGRLIVPYASLQALDLRDGSVVWTSEPYRDFGSPVAARVGGEDAVAAPDGRVLRARDGAVLAKGVGEVYYVGPVSDERSLFFVGSVDSTTKSQRPMARAFSLATLSHGAASPPPLWTAALEVDRYYASPLVHDGVLYALSESGYFTGLDASNGKRLFMEDLDFMDAKPSVASAGRFIYLSDSSGRTIVYRGGREVARVADNHLEPFRATPYFTGSRMYVRAHTALYCIGR
ncbi:MAG: PQQ-binding-like beta-propeller repeat protein [Myxococcota bacterium]